MQRSCEIKVINEANLGAFVPVLLPSRPGVNLGCFRKSDSGLSQVSESDGFLGGLGMFLDVSGILPDQGVCKKL